MTLPYQVDFRGFPACPCLAAWIPVYESELHRRKLLTGPLRIYQLIGGAPASGNTHTKGGAIDDDRISEQCIWVARQMGADASWHRPPNWDGKGGMEHAHHVLTGCPHNGPARYQIDAVRAGYNGLGLNGHGARDTGPRPLSGRTWQEGIKWAKEQAAKPKETVVPIKPVATPHIDNAINELGIAIAARGVGPVRYALRTARRSALVARKLAKGA